MRAYFVATAALLAAHTALAQTPVPSPTPPNVLLAWDHDGVNVDEFRVLADGALVITAIAPDARMTPFPALTPGTHSLAVQACNVAGCSTSQLFMVRVVVVPRDATNIRIEIVP